MLKVRVMTAVALLAILLPVLWLQSFAAFAVITSCFFAASIWESFRLFGVRRAVGVAAIWTVLFVLMLYVARDEQASLLYAFSVAIWAFRLLPALAVGLPPVATNANLLLSGVYGVALLGCFTAMSGLFARSPLYLLSVLVIVWLADVGAYFFGKALGKRKLAPSISPGKSWEGAIGGWITATSVTAALVILFEAQGTFPAELRKAWGWPGFVGLMTLIIAASVVGDLFESLLKRRAGFKDSSALLPGHGGVLDRVDALVPALPLAALVASRF